MTRLSPQWLRLAGRGCDGLALITGDAEFVRAEDIVRIAWLDSFA